MNKFDLNLRTYLQKNHHKLITWAERVKIINDITIALERIHKENAIHRDLHSGNEGFLLLTLDSVVQLINH